MDFKLHRCHLIGALTPELERLGLRVSIDTENGFVAINAWAIVCDAVHGLENRSESFDEDIDTHRFRCSKCGRIGYYSEAARRFFEKGIKSSGINGPEQLAPPRAHKVSCRRHARRFQITQGHNRPETNHRTGCYMAAETESVERPEVRRAIRVALEAGSDLQIAGRRALAERRNWWCNACLALAVVAIPGAVWLVDVFQFGYAAGLLCCAAVVSGIAASVRSRARADIEANSPLSGDDVSEAVELVQVSVDAAQYRDGIVKSGRKLYGFDLAAMRRLDAREDVRRADRLDTAQREWLHKPGDSRPTSSDPIPLVRETSR
ncbi:hypothetical protein [Paraburkholderia youngii]|uniref:hypothetical protein n=1 Tax=Paraburkholderia youngii TaxID=2782701 RepID=UPI003D238CDA